MHAWEKGLKISADHCWVSRRQEHCCFAFILYLLRHHDQFQKVCVAPDKMEHEEHKRLVTELKERRSEG